MYMDFEGIANSTIKLTFTIKPTVDIGLSKFGIEHLELQIPDILADSSIDEFRYGGVICKGGFSDVYDMKAKQSYKIDYRIIFTNIPVNGNCRYDSSDDYPTIEKVDHGLPYEFDKVKLSKSLSLLPGIGQYIDLKSVVAYSEYDELVEVTETEYDPEH